MPEGLSPAEVGKEIAEHKKHAAAEQEDGHQERWLSIVEAVLLSLVAVLAAYSGYAAAKWGTESSVTLAKASAAAHKGQPSRHRGGRDPDARLRVVQRVVHRLHGRKRQRERLAERRMRPGYRPAFNAWLATDPAHNRRAPPGPAYMPQYVIPQEAAAKALDAKADEAFAEGAKAGSTADKYIRDTVFLATVLFLVGISGHFRVRQARLGLISMGGLLLAFAVSSCSACPDRPRSSASR